jgi:DDE superfamily endonuclease
VITYRVTLDVPLQLVIKVSNLLRKRRKELGTRNGTRALTCYQQAVFILAWFRDRPGLSRLGQGFGISQATAYRYKDEGVEVLRALAPTLHDTLEKVAEQGLPYLILDGTLIASDRCSDKNPATCCSAEPATRENAPSPSCPSDGAPSATSPPTHHRSATSSNPHSSSRNSSTR